MHCRDFWIKNNTFLFRKMKSKMFSKCQTFCFRLSAKCILFTHWFRITHIWVNKQTTIGSDNGLSPGRSQAIIWTNDVILSIGQTFAHPHILSIIDLSFYCNESTAVLNNQVTIHRPANKNTKTRLQMEKKTITAAWDQRVWSYSTQRANEVTSQIARFMRPTWGPPGSCWPQMCPMLAPWTLLSGVVCLWRLGDSY